MPEHTAAVASAVPFGVKIIKLRIFNDLSDVHPGLCRWRAASAGLDAAAAGLDRCARRNRVAEERRVPVSSGIPMPVPSGIPDSWSKMEPAKTYGCVEGNGGCPWASNARTAAP